MQYIKGLKDYHDDSQTAVTLGKFDGVHRGHEKLVEKVIEYADTAGVKSVVCAFDMLAFSKKHVDERCILMTKEERKTDFTTGWIIWSTVHLPESSVR